MVVKEDNEITVNVLCDGEVLCNILEQKGFYIVDSYTLNDIYMIPDSIDIYQDKFNIRDVLKKAILIRDIQRESSHLSQITFKNKVFDPKGSILSQRATNCTIFHVEEATSLFEAMGYRRLMTILENGRIYEKDNFGLEVKRIQNDAYTLIEIETGMYPEFNTIEKLKKGLMDLELPICTDDFFIKKAEIELNKLIHR